jgi:hypothetical protein
MPQSSRGMTAEYVGPAPKSPATVSLCNAFSRIFKPRNESGTNRGRIADSPSLPDSFTQHLAPPDFPRTRWSFGLRHKRRFQDEFLKTGESSESNQNRPGVKWIHVALACANYRKRPHAKEGDGGGTAGSLNLSRLRGRYRPPLGGRPQETPRRSLGYGEAPGGGSLHIRNLDCGDTPTPALPRKRAHFLRGSKQAQSLRVPGPASPHCVFATLGGCGVVMKLVASSIAGPKGVGTFSQNGTRTRVPATGAKAISMLRWAARYLITGRSGM